MKKEIIVGNIYKRKPYNGMEEDNQYLKSLSRKVLEIKWNGDILREDGYGIGLCGRQRFISLYSIE